METDEPTADEQPRLPRKAAGKSTKRVVDPNAWLTADETFPAPLSIAPDNDDAAGDD